jgi:hypothetical protein
MGMVTSCSKVRLYVKSVKTVVRTTETEHEIFGRTALDQPGRVKVEGSLAGGTFRLRQFAEETEPKHDYVLSEDQQKLIEMVKDIAREHCLEVEVVDVAKENVLRRVIQKEKEKIRTFSALIAGDGQKIEGEMTEKQVESFLSRIVDEARKGYL